MKGRAMRRHDSKVLFLTLVFFLVAMSAYADNLDLADELHRKLLAMDGFTAVYKGHNSTSGQDLNVETWFSNDGRVRMDVTSQNFTTFYDGKVVYLWDKGSSQVLAMSLDKARGVLKEAMKSLQKLEWLWPEAAAYSGKTDIQPFVLIDLSEGTANLAITFAVKACDAPWLNRLEENDAPAKKSGGEIIATYGDYVHRIDAKTGVLTAVEHVEKDRPVRWMRMSSFTPGRPDASLFQVKFPDNAKIERIDTDASAIDAVSRSGYNAAMGELLKIEADRFPKLSADEKLKISAAVKEYWQTVFRKNTEMTDRLVAMVDTAESRALIESQLNNEKAFEEFKKTSNISDAQQAKDLWPQFVSASIAQEILRQILQPLQESVVNPMIAKVKRLEARNVLTREQGDELLRVHTEPIIAAMMETMMGPIRARIDVVIDKIGGAPIKGK
jgi:hypothetical protein